MAGDSGFDNGFESELTFDTDKKLDEPKMFKVILHNDNYTTMDFVVEVLMKVFHMPAAKATKIMLDVHNAGKGICGIFTLDIARTKVNQVHEMAKIRDFPLKSSYEEA